VAWVLRKVDVKKASDRIWGWLRDDAKEVKEAAGYNIGVFR